MYSMKLVLLVDGSPMLRDFLYDKLSVEQVSLESVVAREAFKKMNNLVPTLILVEISDALTEDQVYFLKKKEEDPNGRRIPLMVIGNFVKRYKISTLMEFGITKYFSKPIRFGVFFKSLGKYLHVAFSLDTTPSISELHLNGSLIFIEMSEKINREQVTLLKYQLTEIIANHKITLPKVILMMSGMNLSFIDGINLEFLIDNISAEGRIPNKCIKILTFDKYVDAFIAGHVVYTGIQVTSDIKELFTFAEVQIAASVPIQNLVIEKIINTTDPLAAKLDFIDFGDFVINDELHMLNVAILDNDVNVQTALKAVVSAIPHATSTVFSDAASFINSSSTEEYDVIIMEVYLPDIDGVGVLKELRARNFASSVIIYSVAPNQEIASQLLSLGAKAFLIKPQTAETILATMVKVLQGGNR